MTNLTTIQEALEQVIDNDSVRSRSYSGRGMYGKECLAIVGDFGDCMEAIGAVISLLSQEVFDATMDGDQENVAYALNDQLQKAIDSLLKFQQDSMGLSVVVYWPRLEYDASSEDDGEDDEQAAD